MFILTSLLDGGAFGPPSPNPSCRRRTCLQPQAPDPHSLLLTVLPHTLQRGASQIIGQPLSESGMASYSFMSAPCTRHSDWGMDRTVVAQFSCHQPSLLAAGTLPDRRTAAKKAHRSGRHVFVGGRCGGAAPAQGRPLAADRTEQQWIARIDFARLIKDRKLILAETLRIFWAGKIGRYESTQ